MTDEELLVRFRTSGYARGLRSLLERRLKAERDDSLTQPANELSRLRIQAVRGLLDELFGSDA